MNQTTSEKSTFNKKDNYWVEKPILNFLNLLAGAITKHPDKMAIFNETYQ